MRRRVEAVEALVYSSTAASPRCCTSARISATRCSIAASVSADQCSARLELGLESWRAAVDRRAGAAVRFMAIARISLAGWRDAKASMMRRIGVAA